MAEVSLQRPPFIPVQISSAPSADRLGFLPPIEFPVLPFPVSVSCAGKLVDSRLDEQNKSACALDKVAPSPKSSRVMQLPCKYLRYGLHNGTTWYLYRRDGLDG